MAGGDLTGHVALVTGAQQGIGAATARALGAAGAAVVVNHLDPGAGDDVVVAIESQGGRAVAVRGDVSRRADVDAMVAAGEELGGVDLLVNNAGIFPRVPFLELETADWDAVVDVNLRGTFAATQAVARGLRDSRRPGAVVSLASVAAYRASARGVHYAATKGAIVSFTRAAALELAPLGIRVNAIAPGLVDTAQPRDGLTEEQIATASAQVPLGTMAVPDDIAAVAVFLLGDAARHVTGEIVHVNGGSYTGG